MRRRRAAALVVPPVLERGLDVPLQRHLRFHLVAAGAVLLLGAVAVFALRSTADTAPSRGYTPLGLTSGIVGTLCFLGVALYTLRKRAGQEWIPGRLDLWLRLHTWLSFLGCVLVLVHAGFHVDGGLGTWALVLLVGAVGSGVGGMLVYRLVPGAVVDGPRNLATGATDDRLTDLRARIDEEQAGRSVALRAQVRRLVDPRAPVAVGALAPGEQDVLARVKALLGQTEALRVRRERQQVLRRWLRTWLWIHVPIAILFVGAIGVHVYDATDAKFLLREPRPDDFASPESCLPCHRTQYEEWIRSPHAVAQSSPIMDLQHRLVVLEDRRRERAGLKPIAGDVCVKCHAPTGYLGDPANQEDLLTPIGERAPASRFGISCVTCHQIDSMHANPPDPNGIVFRNLENFTWRPGRTYFGAFGASGELASVGNAAHRGAFGEPFTKPEFCASCHTVVVANPNADDRQTGTVKLQDTFTEWRDGSDAMNWSKEGTSCLHCHNRPLRHIAAKAEELAARRAPLDERFRAIRAALLDNPLAAADSFAAEPIDGFDRPLLPGRRRFLHTFTGVDERLSADVPFPVGHARHGENRDLRAQAQTKTQELMSIAAAVRTRRWPSDGKLVVDVMNLGTGHHLPAGFAFAREMWLEVAVGPTRDGPFRVIVGGDGGGHPIEGATPLPKADSTLRNYQAVLFDSTTGRETVIQNEATGVLKGDAAKAKGFRDRVGFLKPGEVRAETIDLGAAGFDSQRGPGFLRVRLRFRSLPPEFIAGAVTPTHGGGLATRFDALKEPDNAKRARDLLADLVVLTMAEDLLAR